MAAARLISLALVALTLGLRPADAGDAPKAGPSYPHRSLVKREIGSGPRSYTLFEPAEPTPKKAPVVVFIHGWLAMNPGVYGAWVDHLVRSGNIVIYPRYMDEWETPVEQFLPNTLAAMVDAFDVLDTSSVHVKPDRTKVALIGHSTGGVLAVQVAASAKSRRLPEPVAVVAVTPGELLPTKGPDLAAIGPKTLLVVVAAEHDLLVGDGPARRIYREAASVMSSRKKFVLYRTDLRGRPYFWADHLAPTAALASLDNGDGPFRLFQMGQGATNALDREGFWKVADITLAAGFAGRTLDEATDRGASFRRLGYWSDGRPVLAPIVVDDLGSVRRLVPSNGFRLVPWPAVDVAPP